MGAELFLHGVGYLTGPTLLTNEFLDSLGCSRTALVASDVNKFSILKPEYLESTKNSEPAEARFNTVKGTFRLGADACLKALEDAQLTKEDLSLLIADTTTPYEVTPAESQRICQALEVKIPAFDVNTGALGIPLLLADLLSWKKERLDGYIMCVSVHAPSLAIDFSKGCEGYIFSDSASACIISNKLSDLKILSAATFVKDFTTGGLKIPINDFLQIDNSFLESGIRQSLEVLLQNFSDKLTNYKNLYIAGNDYGTGQLEKIVAAKKLKNCHVYNVSEKLGETLGSSFVISLDELKAQLQIGDLLFMLSPGGGSQSGALLVEKIAQTKEEQC